MAYSKKLTTEQNKARARADSHKYRHKTNNLPARTHNRAARLAAQWVQTQYPAQWKKLVQQAQQVEAEKDNKYVPHSVRYAMDTCSHSNVKAVGSMRQCQDCGEFLGAWAVEQPVNQDLLQDILEAEQGA